MPGNYITIAKLEATLFPATNLVRNVPRLRGHLGASGVQLI